jgi:Domain of unknown function (DUF4440)
VDLQLIQHAGLERALRRVRAMHHLCIGERGFQFDKRQWIDRHPEFRYLAIETTEVDVRRYNRAAIVRCVQRSRASWRGGPMTLAVRLSQVWIRQADGWRLAGIQFSTLDPG